MTQPEPLSSQNPLDNIIDGFQMDISHQEMDRIITELEAVYGSQPTTWLPVEAIGMMLTHELGYEDLEEFEDALKLSWPDFLSRLPHVEVKPKEDGSGTPMFRVKPPPPVDQQVPTKLTFKVKERKDLWRVCLVSPGAKAYIPELEFEIGADSKRHIDSLYNHIATATFNLSTYCRTNSAMPDDDREKIAETVDKLNQLLDVEEPWTWVVVDQAGLSEMKPTTDVLSEPLVGSDAS